MQAESVLSEFYCRQVPGSSYLKVQDLLEADILQTIEEGGSEALRTMLLEDSISFASTEPPHNQTPQTNGDTADSLSSQVTPVTAAVGGPSPLSSAEDAATCQSPEGWKQQQLQQPSLQQLEPDASKPQQVGVACMPSDLQHDNPSSPAGSMSPLSMLEAQRTQQQGQQNFSNPYSMAANPFSHAELGDAKRLSIPEYEEMESPDEGEEELHFGATVA
ncbi:coatomer protein complex subunit [Cyclospora cayetanensis]|uniref:Coatomer protein complex subunit n=1 Tax=Cyclospora cayetanensis TaxID=88456 RepID=A0A1D3DAH8_9EIME|nr:coatomer protein complex subunit [Cyclospora cayetanensis]